MAAEQEAELREQAALENSFAQKEATVQFGADDEEEETGSYDDFAAATTPTLGGTKSMTGLGFGV